MQRCATDTGPHTDGSPRSHARPCLHIPHELTGGWKLCRHCDGPTIGQHIGEPSWWGRVLEALDAEAGRDAERIIADGG